jgi:hypothetical protein
MVFLSEVTRQICNERGYLDYVSKCCVFSNDVQLIAPLRIITRQGLVRLHHSTLLHDHVLHHLRFPRRCHWLRQRSG